MRPAAENATVFHVVWLHLQIKVANIDATTGKYEGDYQVYALCGFIRGKVRFSCFGRAWCCCHSRTPSKLYKVSFTG